MFLVPSCVSASTFPHTHTQALRVSRSIEGLQHTMSDYETSLRFTSRIKSFEISFLARQKREATINAIMTGFILTKTLGAFLTELPGDDI